MELGVRIASIAAVVLALVRATDARGEEPRIERPPEFTRRVNAAIDSGVAWLKTAKKVGGAYRDNPVYPGATSALAYFTLRVCGVPSTDSTATTVFDLMREKYAAARRTGDFRTYSAA